MYCFTIRTLQLITLVSCAMIFSTFAMEESPSTALDDYKLFKVVQRILDITDELRKEFKEKYEIDIRSGREKNFLSDWQVNQTQQGLFIQCDNPFLLYTPWGQIMLTGVKEHAWKAMILFRQALFKRMKTSFWGVYQFKLLTFLDPKDSTFYELKPDIDLKKIHIETGMLDDVFREVPGGELQDKVGQDTFIQGKSFAWDYIYKIHEVDGEQLPEAEYLEELKDYEETSKVRSAWENLNEQYKASRRNFQSQ